MLNLLATANQAQHRLSSLTVHKMHPIHTHCLADLDTYTQAAKSLTSIRLNVTLQVGYGHEPFAQDPSRVNLYVLLSKSPHLRELRLGSFGVPLSNFLANPNNPQQLCIWPHLRVLNLTNFAARTAFLLRFLESHHATLEVVTLAWGRLESGVWSEVFTHLRDDRQLHGRFPRLRTIRFSGLLHSEPMKRSPEIELGISSKKDLERVFVSCLRSSSVGPR